MLFIHLKSQAAASPESRLVYCAFLRWFRRTLTTTSRTTKPTATIATNTVAQTPLLYRDALGKKLWSCDKTTSSSMGAPIEIPGMRGLGYW
jgi:hypothetical protein